MLATAAIAVLMPQWARGENALLDAAISSITADELFEHVDVLADDTLEGRAAGSRGGQVAARYIESRLQQLGVEPAGERGRFTQTFNGSHRNVLARIEGGDDAVKSEWVVVGAHFDHVGYGTPETSNGPLGHIHNGADDNASGVSVLLETIEAFGQLGRPPRRSILFAFWDGEEQGLLGSRHWVQNPTVPLASVALAINIDMVGRLREGRLEVGGTRSGFGLRQSFASRSLPPGLWLDYDWELKENSDHWPFFQRGIPVVLLHTGMHEDYHRPSDDIERVNRDGMRDVAVYLLDVAYRAATVDGLPSFRSAAREETPYTRRRREEPLAALPPRLGVMFRNAEAAELTAAQVTGVARAADGAPPAPEDDLPRGVVVTKVDVGSPAEGAGLLPGDRVVGIGGRAVHDEAQFQQLVLAEPARTRVLVARRTEEEPVSLDVRLSGRPVRLGISWRDDPAEPGTVYLTRVVSGSLASDAGLRVYDRIHAVDGATFRGQDEFRRLLHERLREARPFTFGVERFGRLLDVAVPSHPDFLGSVP